MRKNEKYSFEDLIIPQGAGDGFRMALSWYKAALEKIEAPVRAHNVTFSCVLTLALSISYLNSKSAFMSEKALLKEVRNFLVPENYSDFLFTINAIKNNERDVISDEFVLFHKEMILINDYDSEKGYSMAFMILHILEDCFED